MGKRKEGFWEIEGNSWSKSKYSEKEAIKLSKTMINCESCCDCENCFHVYNSLESKGCTYSKYLSNCKNVHHAFNCHKEKNVAFVEHAEIP